MKKFTSLLMLLGILSFGYAQEEKATTDTKTADKATTDTRGGTDTDDGYELVDISEDPPAKAYPLTGVITDGKGNPIPNANVMIFNSDETIAEVPTDAEGRYKVEEIVPGVYHFIIRTSSGKNVIQYSVNVASDKGGDQNFQVLVKKLPKVKKEKGETRLKKKKK